MPTKPLATIVALFFPLLLGRLAVAQAPAPLRVGIAGLTHTHVHGILGRAKRGDIVIVGIAEPNRELAQRYLQQYGLPMSLVYNSLAEMLAKTKPEAVTAFGSIYQHLEVVQTCAPKGIHVMVEKPLAVNMDHARQMQALAQKHHIHLLTNYETTWYGSNREVYQLVQNKALGDVRRIVAHDGHQGPKEIGVNKEFLDWLTDPVQNGGGALPDFGCYGADLMTWLMHGERPLSVTASALHIKPDVYPKVEDDVTILVNYPKAQGVIQASWNWPYARKDLEVYGQTGSAIALDRDHVRVRRAEKDPAKDETVAAPPAPYDEPFAYLAAVVRGTAPEDVLSSLPTNMLVVEILDAARQSIKEGKTVQLPR
ncbi:Gfo/Idh/MocA family oxidoreductase [Hymenobacter ginsengisoli]|uniref:Gfo/Idh/MocA family oxidoreductase n=1 Tax=Hymenobacter ginsengisoli TaxID=1051626 RepID=A0ABP8QLD2_9BACT|nr:MULTISPECIES: Gfo/Idh/MocA family oxidoreductase [unclassified Hymenobacter]MBO2031074.1 Gfo/Idh/MocA family oxidoreductase [Hymenobacter sp. BT559]